jgi:hypothetical protein
MRTMYPEIEPYRTHRIAVDGRHTLYVEECGNPDGLPVISCTAVQAPDFRLITGDFSTRHVTAWCCSISVARVAPRLLLI